MEILAMLQTLKMSLFENYWVGVGEGGTSGEVPKILNRAYSRPWIYLNSPYHEKNCFRKSTALPKMPQPRRFCQYCKFPELNFSRKRDFEKSRGHDQARFLIFILKSLSVKRCFGSEF